MQNNFERKIYLKKQWQWPRDRYNAPCCDCFKNEKEEVDFLFFYNIIFKGWIGLKNWENFPKNHVFPVLRIHKNDPMTLVLWYFVDSVSDSMRPKL